MITRATRSPINRSGRNCAGDNIWEYNEARSWSHLLLEDATNPCGEKGRPDPGGLCIKHRREGAWHPRHHPVGEP